MGEFNDFFDKEIESSEQIKECLKCQKDYDKKIKELEAKLKQNDFEIIAEGKIIIEEKAVWLNCDVLIGGIFIAFKLKKYKGKNIQIGVKVID